MPIQNERLSEKNRFKDPENDKQRNHLSTKLLDKCNDIEHQITSYTENIQRRVEEIERMTVLINEKKKSLALYRVRLEKVRGMDFTQEPVTEEPTPEPIEEVPEKKEVKPALDDKLKLLEEKTGLTIDEILSKV